MILTHPDPRLKRKAKRVESINEKTEEMIYVMLQEMYKARALGISAPQVGIPYRIIGWDYWYRIGRKKMAYVLFNPQIHLIGKEPDVQINEEGCLSCPGVTVDVVRYQKILATGTQFNGTAKTIRAQGMEAAVIQHEIDHLNGQLIIDYRRDNDATRNIKRLVQ